MDCVSPIWGGFDGCFFVQRIPAPVKLRFYKKNSLGKPPKELRFLAILFFPFSTVSPVKRRKKPIDCLPQPPRKEGKRGKSNAYNFAFKVRILTEFTPTEVRT